MKRPYLVLTSIVLLIVFIIVLMSSSNSYQEIHINSPAYMYEDNINEVVPVSIEGRYNKKENTFIGSMEIDNRIKLDNVTFIPGSGIVFYEGSNRTFLGQIYFDNENSNYSMEIIDPVIYEKLTKRPSDGKAEVIISSPSNNFEQAQQVTEELKNKKLPLEKKYQEIVLNMDTYYLNRKEVK